MRLMKNVSDDVLYGTINAFSEKCSIKNTILVTHFTHHKCGTTWFSTTLRNISKRFGLNFQSCSQKKLNPNTDIWLQWHSKVNFKNLPEFSGTHMIRDPRDVTISAYFYHLWSHEDWCNIPRKEYGGKSYQQYLKGLSKEEGIFVEMSNTLAEGNTTGNIIKDFTNWNYNVPNILELKYDEVILNPNYWFRKILKHYGFNQKEISRGMKIVEKYSFKVRAGRKLGEESKKSHLRKGTPGDWKNHFNEDHKNEFKKLYGDLLIRLGYEKDLKW